MMILVSTARVAGSLLAVLLCIGLAAAEVPVLPAAVAAGEDAVVDSLLAAGVDLDAALPHYYDATALMIAAGNDETELVDRLIAAGADLNRRDRNGDTALNWAAYSGHVRVVGSLLEAGADPTIVGHGNALQIALRRGHEDVVQVLSVAMNARTRLNGRDTSLMLAVYRDDGPAVQEAIVAGAQLDARDDMDRPLLHVAARLGHAEALLALLAAGATVDAGDLNGFTALMVAAREGQSDLVRHLLAAGASATHRAERHALSLTPLHLAAIGGDVECVRALAAAGADLDAQDVDGATAALWGLSEQNLDAVVTLIELGADPTLAHREGDSVATLARRHQIAPVLAAMDEQ